MKECIECGKKLGIIEGYHHPTMGKSNLLCSNCFDTVSASVEKWSVFISPYIGFFNKESLNIDDVQINKENMKNKGIYVWPHKTNENANDNLSTIN